MIFAGAMVPAAGQWLPIEMSMIFATMWVSASLSVLYSLWNRQST